jgi:hypothetical protein
VWLQLVWLGGPSQTGCTEALTFVLPHILALLPGLQRSPQPTTTDPLMCSVPLLVCTLDVSCNATLSTS